LGHAQEKETAALKKAKLAETKEIQVPAPARALPSLTSLSSLSCAYAATPCAARVTVHVRPEEECRESVEAMPPHPPLPPSSSPPPPM
jgi:hypothetical protein